jgi:type IV pilus assembly protein PilA
MTKNNQAGFSLVELMVVVAIIGILATIAVPNFQRFQARAKQASAKTELSGIFTAQKAFFVEYQSYHGDLQMIGFVPEGVTPGATDADDINRLYASSAGTIDEGDNLTYGDLGLTQSAYGAMTPPHYPASSKKNNNADASAQAAATGVANQNSFVAGVAGSPRAKDQTILDVWEINHTRSMKNVSSGL